MALLLFPRQKAGAWIIVVNIDHNFLGGWAGVLRAAHGNILDLMFVVSLAIVNSPA